MSQSLAVGCFASICRDRLADELIAFSRCCPEVDIGVHEMVRAALLPALRTGELSLAVMPGAEEAGTRSVELWQDRVMVALPPDHRLARRLTVKPGELRGEPMLVSRLGVRGDMHRFLSRRILPLGPALDATIVDLGLAKILDRVAQGGGIALTCESQAEHARDGIVAIPVEAPGGSFPVRAYWPDAEPAWPLSALLSELRSSR